jgi:hypothetical protein
MVTGVEEEMKVTSNDDKKQQDKPTETGSTSDNYQISQSQPFHFTISHAQIPNYFHPSSFCLSSARCLSPSFTVTPFANPCFSPVKKVPTLCKVPIGTPFGICILTV